MNKAKQIIAPVAKKNSKNKVLILLNESLSML